MAQQNKKQDDEFVDVKAYGPSWEPQTPDESIKGYYIDSKENVGKFNSTVYTLQLETGEHRTVWGNLVLNELMSTVTPGEFVRIKWLGKVKSKTGSTSYNSFEVAKSVSREPLAIDQLKKAQKITNVTPSSEKFSGVKQDEFVQAKEAKPAKQATPAYEEEDDQLPF